MSVVSRKQSPPTRERRYVSEIVVEEVSGRKRRTLQKDRLFRNGPFPHYKLNRQVVYDLDEVLAIIEASRQGGKAA